MQQELELGRPLRSRLSRADKVVDPGTMSERGSPVVRALSIGVNIRRYRTAEGLTLKELAEKSGVSIATISKIENGRISGGFETIYKIARGLGVLVTEIIIDDDTRELPDLLDWSIHDGEEVVLVLSGKIDLHRENAEPLRLGTGDSACFDSGRRHCFVSVSERPARILSISTRGPATRNAGRLVHS
jgi:transcriptional regulator with XRE-family HTH domain